MDKILENQLENEQATQIQAWAKYLCQAALSQAEFDQAGPVIAKIFEAQQQGNSCIDADVNDVVALKNLCVDRSISQHVAPFVFDQPYLYLYRYWALEHSIATHIHRLKVQDIPTITLTQQHVELLEDTYQQAALSMVAKEAFNIITGGPGTGKTYTLARIIAVLNDAIPNLRVAMAAPTGKAAQRMQEALMASFADLAHFSLQDQKLNPVTIHRLLGLGYRAKPRFNAQQPLPYDVIVIDEASMLDLNLAEMLFAAVAPQTRLILLGDAQQLASVDVGSVLADLQQVKALAPNRVYLRNSRRFQANAMIGKMANFIQEKHKKNSRLTELFEANVVQSSRLNAINLASVGTDLIQLEYLPEQLAKSYNPQDYTVYYDQLMAGFSGFVEILKQPDTVDFDTWKTAVIQRFDQYRILAAIRYGLLGLSELNLQIEKRLLEYTQQRKKGEWYVGRPVMMRYNDYQLGLSNGDIGVCFLRKHVQGDAQFEVYFSSLDKWIPATRLPKNIETAYAMTIHKSQGSEFSHTAVVLEHHAQQLLSKELIYTAITRAKKVVSLLVDHHAFEIALSRETVRISGLQQQLQRNFVS